MISGLRGSDNLVVRALACCAILDIGAIQTLGPRRDDRLLANQTVWLR